MARLTSAERAKLPDRAFAYVDSRGRRRLPIVDAPHVRNALSRFNQVEFDDDRARDQARTRLLRAARKYRIVPVGFIDSQLRTQRGAERRDVSAGLPTGFVTMLMTDIEGSTGLLARLGDTEVYGSLLADVRRTHGDAVAAYDGRVVEARADDFFAAFTSPRCALEAAIDLQRGLASHDWPGDLEVRVRAGLHAGYPTVRDGNYVGMAVHTTARISDAAHGGQIVISDTKMALTDMVPDGVRFRSLGRYQLRGIPDEHTLFQIAAPGLGTRFPSLRTSAPK